MKTFIFVLFLCILIDIDGIAQTLTPEQREKILQGLQSDKFGTLLEAAADVAEHKIIEAIPILEQRLWSVNPLLQIWFLRALWEAGSPNTLALTRAFIDSVDRYKNRGVAIDPLSEKVYATEILFDYGDYSGAPLVFELLERSRTIYPSGALLRKIVESVPEYSERARQEMRRLVREGETSLSRGYALRDLIQLYGLGVSDLILHMATTDSVETNRLYAIEMLRSLGYPQIKSFLYDRLFNEPYAGYRRLIADTLLKRYGTPEDYRQVQQYVQFEQDTVRKSLASRAFERFKPPVPPPTTPVSVMLDTLISTKHQVFALGWLGDKNFVNELDNHLENAQKHLARRDSVNCGKEVEKFQEKVQKEYEKTVDNEKKNKPRDKRFVTVEAWKFLYYHAQYVIDRLLRKKK